MKNLFIMLILCAFSACATSNKNAVLHLSIANSTASVCSISEPNQLNRTLLVALKSSHVFKLSKPQFVRLICYPSQQWSAKYLSYTLYLSPGDDVTLNADFNKPNFGIHVSGEGSKNNEPLMALDDDFKLEKFQRDTLPNRVIAVLNAAQKNKQGNFEKYIKLYNPSASYIKDWTTDLRYYSTYLYYSFAENNRLMVCLLPQLCAMAKNCR